jgi:hypothetical protein
MYGGEEECAYICEGKDVYVFECVCAYDLILSNFLLLLSIHCIEGSFALFQLSSRVRR